jgi:hypothetical protein
MNKSIYVETVNNLQAILKEVQNAKDWEEFTQGATLKEIQSMQDLPRWCSLIQSWYREISIPQDYRFVS